MKVIVTSDAKERAQISNFDISKVKKINYYGFIIDISIIKISIYIY
jgi:hypothetical protein